MQKTILDREAVKYIITGVASNTMGYLFYLAVTILLGLGHKTAMTGLYVIGAMVNFYVNRQWTFRGTGSVRYGLVRFLLAIALGYLLNLVGLFIFVDMVGWPHELVMAGAIVVMAVYFFSINKYYVHAA